MLFLQPVSPTPLQEGCTCFQSNFDRQNHWPSVLLSLALALGVVLINTTADHQRIFRVLRFRV